MTDIDIQVETITPETAREWLDQTRINRPRRDDQVQAYARDMRAGKWRPVAVPICFDRLGNLVDGQHRLAAIVVSGVDLVSVVQRGLEPEDQLVIDSGVKRRAADQLILSGHKYGVRTAAVAAGLHRIWVGRPYDQKLRVTNTEIFEVLAEHPTIIDSVLAVEGIYRLARITPLNAAIAHYVGSQKIPVTTYNFFEKVKSGVNMPATDPAMLLRGRMLTGFDRPSGMQQLWLIARALELTKKDVQSYTKIQLPHGSRVTPDQLNSVLNALTSFADERQEV